MPGSLKWVKRREAYCTDNDMETIHFSKDKDIMEHNDERDMLMTGKGEKTFVKESTMHVVQDRLSSFVEEHHQQPLYAEADIRWKDTGEGYTYLFKLSGNIDERTDGEIFFNCNGMEEFMSLLQKDNGEDFTVNPESVVFYDKSIFTEESQTVEAEAGKQLDGYARQMPILEERTADCMPVDCFKIATVKELCKEQETRKRVSDIAIFSVKGGGMNIKASIDGKRMMSKPLDRKDMSALTEGTDRISLASKYYAKELENNREKNHSIKR